MYDGFNVKEWIIPANDTTKEWTRPRTANSQKGIAIHWTGNINVGAKAYNNANFFHQRVGTYGSAHYVLDEDTIYHVIPDNEMAYHVGATTYKTKRFGTYPNNQLIGLEICFYLDGDWEKTYDHAVRFVAAICLKKGWNDPWKALIRHFDVTGKDCPLMMTDLVNDYYHVYASVKSMLKQGKVESDAAYARRVEEGVKFVQGAGIDGKIGDDLWNKFIQDVCDAMNGVYKKTPVVVVTPKPDPIPETIEEKVVYFMGKYFADVDDKSWQGKEVNALHEKKTADGNALLGGSTDGNGKLVARPDEPITRGETAALINRAIQYAIEQAKK